MLSAEMAWLQDDPARGGGAEEDEMSGLNALADDIRIYRESKGFVTSKDNMLEKLMLVVSEIAEAAEDVRHDNWHHFGEEIADTIIRCLDITATLGIDIEREIDRKMAINRERPHLHGKKVTA